MSIIINIIKFYALCTLCIAMPSAVASLTTDMKNIQSSGSITPSNQEEFGVQVKFLDSRASNHFIHINILPRMGIDDCQKISKTILVYWGKDHSLLNEVRNYTGHKNALISYNLEIVPEGLSAVTIFIEYYPFQFSWEEVQGSSKYEQYKDCWKRTNELHRLDLIDFQ